MYCNKQTKYESELLDLKFKTECPNCQNGATGNRLECTACEGDGYKIYEDHSAEMQEAVENDPHAMVLTTETCDICMVNECEMEVYNNPSLNSGQEIAICDSCNNVKEQTCTRCNRTFKQHLDLKSEICFRCEMETDNIAEECYH